MRDNKRTERNNQRPEHPIKTLRRLYGYMYGFKGLFWCLVGATLLTIGIELVIPIIIESAINTIGINNGIFVNMSELVATLAILLAVVLLNAFVGLIQARVNAKLVLGFTQRLRNEAFAKVIRAKIKETDKLNNGDIMSRIMNDTDMAARTFSETIMSVVGSMVIIVGCVLIMLSKCWQLALISVGASLISVIVAAFISSRIYPSFAAQQVSLASMNSHVEESLKGFRTSAEGMRENENIRIMDEKCEDLYKKRMKSYRLENLMAPWMLLTGNLNFVLIVIFGAKFTLSGIITIGAMQAFILYSKQFMEPINGMGENLISLQNSLVGAERVFALMDMEEEITSAEGQTDAPADVIADTQNETAIFADTSCVMPEEFKGFDIEKLEFYYHKNLEVLKSIDLCISPGETLAVTGRTGSGKTTLISLLLRFYDPVSGSIRINGCPIAEKNICEIRERITYISQEPQIKDGTILENLLYGTGEPDMERVREVCEKVGILKLIEVMPNGFDTILKKGEEELSQGELQLICIARALLRDTSILILDEATSSVDEDTELMLKSALTSLKKGRTTIVIAHRLSTAGSADHIALIEGGVVKEYGSHDELINLNGVYKELYDCQFSGKEI